ARCGGALLAIGRVAGGKGGLRTSDGAGAPAAAAGASAFGAGAVAGAARCATEPLPGGAGVLAAGSTNRVLTHSTVPQAESSSAAHSAAARRVAVLRRRGTPMVRFECLMCVFMVNVAGSATGSDEDAGPCGCPPLIRAR
ncbi:MAG: hypothetical protein ACK4V1_04460, partial [Burkholderiaceae bacterium]